MTDSADSPSTQQAKSACGPSVWLATGLGIGFMPVAPGTFGAVLGLPLAWAISQIPAIGPCPSGVAQALVIAMVCLVGVPICTRAAQSRLGGKKDPGSIVLDEIASLPITFFLIPLDGVAVVLVGFALHRLFDITKPPPARGLERLPDGLGIMADDWAAGVYSCIVLHLALWVGWLPTVGG